MMPMDRLRQQAVDAPPLDLFGHETDPDEHRNEQPEDRGGREAEVLDDLHVLARSELSKQVGRTNQQQCEQDEIVKNLVANRFTEDVDRNRDGGAHLGTAVSRSSGVSIPIRAALAWGDVTSRTNQSSSVTRSGLSDTR